MSTPKNKLDIFVICAPGLETVTGAEMLRLGVEPSGTESGGISCKGTEDDLMRLNLWLRTASRVVVRVATFHASTFFELERRAKKINWRRYITEESSVSFRVTCKKSKLYHSDAVAERLGKSLSRQVGPAGVERPDEGEDDDSPASSAQLFIVRLFRDEVTISVDASGELLHRRGYRLASAKAPMRETLAAAMLLAAQWDGSAPLLDPLCGSGTLPIEAALLARNIAPGRNRKFAFMNWPGFDLARWEKILADASQAELPSSPAEIIASDRDEGAVSAALENAVRAGVAHDIEIRRLSMTEAINQAANIAGPGTLVANPPYGKRVGEALDPRDLYASLGKSARSRLSRWTIVLISNEPRLIAQLRIPTDLLFSATNGGIPVQIVMGTVPISRS